MKLNCFCKGLSKPDTALLIIRIGVGLVFVIAGVQKLSGMEMTTMMFAQMGLGAFWAWAVAILETVGGLALIVGIGTMIAGAILATIMLVACIIMARMGGFMGIMSPFAYLIGSLALVFSGGGRYSIDSNCPCWKNGTCSTNMKSKGDCACSGDSSKCKCDASCPDCSCAQKKSGSSMTTKTMQCTCSNGVCVCDSTCTGCDCGK